MQGGAYVSIYLHPIDYAEFLIRQVEEDEADSKIQVKKTGINWSRSTWNLGELEPSLVSPVTATPFLRKNGNYSNILIKVENT